MIPSQTLTENWRVYIPHHGSLSRGQGLAAPSLGHDRLPGERFRQKKNSNGWCPLGSRRQTRGSLRDMQWISDVVGHGASKREKGELGDWEDVHMAAEGRKQMQTVGCQSRRGICMFLRVYFVVCVPSVVNAKVRGCQQKSPNLFLKDNKNKLTTLFMEILPKSRWKSA